MGGANGDEECTRLGFHQRIDLRRPSAVSMLQQRIVQFGNNRQIVVDQEPGERINITGLPGVYQIAQLLVRVIDF